MSMQVLHYELGILAKAVHFKNLSVAAQNVGLSQPQLSRIVARLEKELQVVLLDRSARRKSGWTPLALEIARAWESANRRLQADLTALAGNQHIGELHIGTLEGLSAFAINLARFCFGELKIHKIHVDVLDLSDLETSFLSGNLDLMFSSKTPGRQKYRHLLEIGYQEMVRVASSKEYLLLSTFEHGRIPRKDLEQYPHVLVSNSLFVKQHWLEKVGGTGLIPSAAKRGRAAEAEPVLLVGSELLSPTIWQTIEASFKF
ncbi:MAG: LysR family transcriptional regulator [Bdellovibrionaceae bacterium]|nr:LysR family transcriptional regulator [Pseudobdellovibrionaceae bacterium]